MRREHTRNQHKNTCEEIKPKLKQPETNYHDSKHNSLKNE